MTTPISSYPPRALSIDTFRALTMLLMIFVNDLWTLEGVPAWLEHATPTEDKLGFADTIFPAFLFVAGISIPFAISNRLNRGDSKLTIARHILLRSIALIVMGVFHVNLEHYNQTALLPRPYWEILITVGFFLLWLDYPAAFNPMRKRMLQGLGLVSLVVLASIYQGGTPDHPEWMKFRWWGILGLIGWTYLIASLLYLAVRNNIRIHFLLLAFFVLLNSAGKLGWLEPLYFIKPYIWIVGEGSMPALAMAGVIVSLLYQEFAQRNHYTRFWIALGLFATLMLLFGLLTRPMWGINKISATPSWVSICAGLSMIVFGLLVWLIDIHGKEKWFKWIKPAGSSTLTCYLLPYIHYPLYSIVGISLPIVLRAGMTGIVKSLLYAIAIVTIAGLLEKRNIKLKI